MDVTIIRLRSIGPINPVMAVMTLVAVSKPSGLHIDLVPILFRFFHDFSINGFLFDRFLMPMSMLRDRRRCHKYTNEKEKRTHHDDLDFNVAYGIET